MFRLLFYILLFVLFSCSKQKIDEQKTETIVYQTECLSLTQLSGHVYQHTSFLQTDDFGKVPCNGMIVIKSGEAIIIDSPADSLSTAELIRFLDNKNILIKAVVATHFHEDCIAGIPQFTERNIPTYANQMTIDLLKDKSHKPQIGFKNEKILHVGEKKVFLNYFGEGHTSDNIVAYFPDEEILFGGCLVKEINATKGYLGDANENVWSESVTKLKETYPNIKIVIPGHGETGGIELINYTIQLFKN